MSEPVRLAKLAREHLASALNTLQSEENISDELMDTADPIAEAMSALHRIERSGGAVLEGRTEALKKIRASLNQLLGLTDSHPAIEKVMESVALALVKVASLVRYSPGAAPREASPVPVAPAPAPVMAPPMPVMASPAPVVAAPTPVAVAPSPVVAELAPVLTPSPPEIAAPVPVAPVSASVVAAPVPVPASVPVPVPVAVAVSVPVSAPVSAPASAPASAPMSEPAAAPIAPVIPVVAQPISNRDRVSPPAAEPSAAVPAASPPPVVGPTREELARAAARPTPAELAQPRVIVDPAALRADPGPRPVPGAPKIVVELGTNSPSNFYKGLGGSDVIEHGGIFVATYKIPKLGSTVGLRVLLPGNYEFFANAEVRWTREGGSSIDSADPGFGARFTQISNEGRQLVYRYARNREPIFYDDL